MQMKLSEMTFSWTGVDDDTPSGHVLANDDLADTDMPERMVWQSELELER